VEKGWEVMPDTTEVRAENMYNREFIGKEGMTVDVSVGAMDLVKANDLIEVVEHTYLDDTVDGRHAFPEPNLPKCDILRRANSRYSQGPNSSPWYRNSRQ